MDGHVVQQLGTLPFTAPIIRDFRSESLTRLATQWEFPRVEVGDSVSGGGGKAAAATEAGLSN